MNSTSTMLTPQRERFIAGGVDAALVTVLLFFVPVVNGIIGGAVGGYRVRDPRQAVMASLWAVLPVAVVLFFVLGLAGGLVLGAPEQLAPLTMALTGALGMPIGAYLGGLVGAAVADRGGLARLGRSRGPVGDKTSRRL